MSAYPDPDRPIVLRALEAAHEFITADRQSLYDCVVCHNEDGTLSINDKGDREEVAEYDAMLAQIADAITRVKAAS